MTFMQTSVFSSVQCRPPLFQLLCYRTVSRSRMNHQKDYAPTWNERLQKWRRLSLKTMVSEEQFDIWIFILGNSAWTTDWYMNIHYRQQYVNYSLISINHSRHWKCTVLHRMAGTNSSVNNSCLWLLIPWREFNCISKWNVLISSRLVTSVKYISATFWIIFRDTHIFWIVFLNFQLDVLLMLFLKLH